MNVEQKIVAACGLDGLTPRELAVLALFASGHSTKEVGNRLGMATKTAAVHRHNISLKLGIHRVTHLAHYAISVGLVPVLSLEDIYARQEER